MKINDEQHVFTLYFISSGDATARLWNVPEDKEEEIQPIVLNHLPNLNDNKDVTTLDWNVSLGYIDRGNDLLEI